MSAKAIIKGSFIQTIEVRGRISIGRTEAIESKARITVTQSRTVGAKGNIYGTTAQTITAKGRISILVIQTIQSKADILKSISRTVFAKGAIATYRVVDIIDQIRDQDLIDELTYVKSRTTAVSYNKVDAINIVDERVKVEGVQSSRVQVINITDLSRVIRTKWVTTKARIRR